MVGVVSHELKSPLSSVGSFLSSLSQGVYGELTEKTQDKVSRTYNSVKRLMGLVGELLYLDRLELEMHPEEIKVDELLETSLDTVKELSKKTGIEIKSKSAGGSILADRNRLVQVLVNLLSNAMKFSPDNGVVTLDSEFNDDCFECRITDQGPGIPETFRKQIFDPFQQVDATDATTKKGTGLGLTISRSIVEQHGGQIGVDSEIGKGSTFWFKIPVRKNLDTPYANPSNSLAAQSSNVISAISPLTNSHGKTRDLQSGKYGVMKQGLVIIALPLLFQLGFAVVFNHMLDDICKQTEHEHTSMKVLHELNDCTNSVVGSLVKAVTNVYVPNPLYETAWTDGTKKVFASLNAAIALSSANQDQVKTLMNLKRQLEAFANVFQDEERTHESRNAFNKLNFAFRAFVYSKNRAHLEPSNEQEALEAQNFGLSPMIMLDCMRALGEDSIHKKLPPFLKIQNYLNKAMDRERKISQDAALQRSKMMNTMQQTLLAGILFTVVISITIALRLMQNLTNRLQHVMQNTQRLVKREKLDSPVKGNDEIAYLDQILSQAGNRLVELENFKRELVAIVSHELRTPLLSISSALELFGTGMYGQFSEKALNRLSFARAEADRLIRLINDLLDIEKMEAGKFVLDLSELKAIDLVKTSVSAVAQLAESRQIQIDSLLIDEDLSFTADRDRICQVLINLLSNAIKYSPDSGTIKLSAQKLAEGDLKWSVEDQGRGIPEELRVKVFDRFVQVEKADATVRGGTGLGLAICKAIIEAHGGQIDLESTPGMGSCFWFSIPGAVKQSAVGPEAAELTGSN